jgi:hypothetical protein
VRAIADSLIAKVQPTAGEDPMPPLFGGKDEGQDDVAVMTADIDRLDALPLRELAAEVMTKGFGSDGPGAPGQTRDA